MFYIVAWGVVAVGVLLIVLSPFAGGLLHTQAITPLIDLLGAPEDREFLPNESRTGTEILALLGAANLVVGICIFLVRLVIELLGLAGKSRLTRRMRPPGKLALGTAAAGLVVFAAAASLEILIFLLFDGYESSIPEIMSALDVISQAGRLLLVCSFITLFLWGSGGIRGIPFGWGHRIRSVLFGWPDAVGWAKLRCGWINRLALALIVGGLICMTLQFMMPFDDVDGAFFSTGMAALALGIVPELLARRRP